MIRKRVFFLLMCSMHTVYASQKTVASHTQNVQVDSRDINLILEGRIREEFCYFDRIVALRDNHNDSFHFFRHKATFGAYGEYGTNTYGQPAVTGRIKLCSYNYWDKPTQYARLSEETIKINSGRIRDEIAIGSDHTHYGTTPHVYLKQGWVAVHFDMLSQAVTLPLSIKAGYFRYKVGRGVSLGDYHEGSISFMGWQDRTCESNADQSPPGIACIAEFSEGIQAELYYSKWRSRTTSPQETHAPVLAQRLSVSTSDKDPAAIERGTKSDHELCAVRLLCNGAHRSGIRWQIEPYGLYVHAPEQSIELSADASTTLGTGGLLCELSSDFLSINAEVAVQSGTQTVHAIDRNSQEIARNADGKMVAQYTHLLQSDYTTQQEVSDTVHSHASREINRSDDIEPFAPLRDQTGATVGSVITSTYPFLAKHRFRSEYEIALQGYMALLDIRLRLMPGLYASAAGAIISGGDYPYNEEKNKTYHGFIPLRDQNYYGRYVHSYAVLHARKFPRPTNMADQTLYAFNHDEDCSNLRYIGVGLEWRPLENRDALIITPVGFIFWQDVPPYAWDATATRASFGNAIYDAGYVSCLEKLGIAGAQTTTRARSEIGKEVSLSMRWNIAPSCQLSGAATLFFPGGMYRDVAGMPNRNARRQRSDGSILYEGLGSATLFGCNLRLSFVF